MPSNGSTSTVKASVRLVMMHHKLRDDGLAPIYVRAISHRKARHKATGVWLEPRHWNDDARCVRRTHDNHEALNDKLRRIRLGAEAVALDKRSAPAVVTALRGGGSLTAYLQRFIDDLDARDRYWEVRKFRTLDRKLHAALKRESLNWADLDLAALKVLETYLIVTAKNRPNTVRKEFTRLHRVVRQAVQDGEIRPSDNPLPYFTLPRAEKVVRRKLTRTEVDRVLALSGKDGVVEGSHDALARDVFGFSFYACGPRFSDCAKLKATDIRDGRVRFVTLKTGAVVDVILPPEAVAIVDRHLPSADDRGGFVFPMLKEGDDRDPTHLRKRINRWNVTVNAALKTLARKAEIEPEGLSMHVARHSFADHARVQGASWDAIGKALGQESIKTTQVYLRSFDQDAVDDLTRSVWQRA